MVIFKRSVETDIELDLNISEKTEAAFEACKIHAKIETLIDARRNTIKEINLEILKLKAAHRDLTENSNFGKKKVKDYAEEQIDSDSGLASVIYKGRILHSRQLTEKELADARQEASKMFDAEGNPKNDIVETISIEKNKKKKKDLLT